MVFLKEFFEKVDFENNPQTTKKHEKFPRGQRVLISTKVWGKQAALTYTEMFHGFSSCLIRVILMSEV